MPERKAVVASASGLHARPAALFAEAAAELDVEVTISLDGAPTDAPCKRCETPIVREKFMNRSSHFCPVCQRNR
jgi:hypothetical protein